MTLMRTALGTVGLGLWLAAACLADDAQTQGTLTEERIIEHQLDTSESRVLRWSDPPFEQQQLQRDLGATGQRLRTLKTEHPNAAGTPLLERQLDRSSRPTRVIQPGPPTLLDRR